MGRITQRVEPEPLAGRLLEHGRAAVAFDDAGAVTALPARVRRRDGELWVGVPRESVPPSAGLDRVTVLLDDGEFWFELRAVNWRGRLAAADAPAPDGREDLAWFVFTSRRATAWDYATLHEERDA
ncbi:MULTISPECIES: hypothetical protein [unclassified Rhodococcus (in: high G+C Gram-positive bacteria)]|uniref:hypothetical protein n=1 Tax=unclassified Rhodococcus (in: high G+C Gram-positive bacteria) TaxID=192944 RepID=UPI000925C7E3|nr:hypothetical protein [Rhodococcus sp. M8]OLL16710.1 hypothetical protein BKE56_025545 [Rhodococcus sp. M8]QPG46786.1 hypothetical protein ISO16_07170 [Rhodococcus sp. M8]